MVENLTIVRLSTLFTLSSGDLESGDYEKLRLVLATMHKGTFVEIEIHTTNYGTWAWHKAHIFGTFNNNDVSTYNIHLFAEIQNKLYCFQLRGNTNRYSVFKFHEW